MMGKVTSWLLSEPVGGVNPSFDKYTSFFFKTFYLLIRVFFRIILGKEKRSRSTFLNRIYAKATFGPSFLLLMYLYKIKKLLKIGNQKLIEIYVTKYDYKAYCPPNINDFISMTSREDDIIEHFRPKKDDNVVDIGAHIGRYAIISSKMVGENGKVVAIEANPAVFEMLNKNIKLNQLTNILSLNYAVYSQETTIKLFLPNDEENMTIYNSIMPERANNKEKFVEVNANTLDTIIQSTGIKEDSINWIKIDVEGAEYEVLQGSTSILSQSKDIALLVEIHNLGEGRNMYGPIVNFLNNYNFKIDFEKTYESGEKHVIFKKNPSHQSAS